MVANMFAKRLLLSVWVFALVWVWAAPPPFPENALGVGYAYPGKGWLQAAAVLPGGWNGLEAGGAFFVASNGERVDAGLDAELLVFPGLAVGSAFGEAGAFLRLDAVKDGRGLGVGGAFGLSAGLEYADPLPFAVFGRAGLGYLRGFRLAWGLGLRAYPAEAWAVDLGVDDRLGWYFAVSYLW